MKRCLYVAHLVIAGAISAVSPAYAEAMPDVKCHFEAEIIDVLRLSLKFQAKFEILSVDGVAGLAPGATWPTVADCGIKAGERYATETPKNYLPSVGDRVMGVSTFNGSKGCILGESPETPNRPAFELRSKN